MGTREDEKNLLLTYISSYFCKDLMSERDFWVYMPSLELISRTQCNQQCDYCYIHKFGKELYPTHISKEEYINRTKAIFEFAKEYKIFIHELNIFSGDIMSDNLLYDMLDIIKDYTEYVMKNGDKTVIQDRCVSLVVPINTYYLDDEYHKQQILKYQKNLREVGCMFNISISTDGLYAVDSREKKSLDQAFYDRLFEFAKESDAGFHPMIAAENIDTAIKNVKWWVQMYENMGRKTKYPFLLHVRNNNWTDEKIDKYCELLDYLWLIRWEQYNHDVELMAQHILSETHSDMCEGFDPLLLKEYVGSFGDEYGCSVQHFLFIDLSDMTIDTCHRLTYPQFKAGKLIMEDNKIVDVEPMNVALWASILDSNPMVLPKCYNCEYKHLCFKGCLGSQFENSGEFMIPINSVCKLEKARTNRLLKLMSDHGVLQYILKNDMLRTETAKLSIINICKKEGYNYE